MAGLAELERGGVEDAFCTVVGRAGEGEGRGGGFACGLLLGFVAKEEDRDDASSDA